jgi:hypothetical protein
MMQAWHETWAREALRVLKPGGHLLAFGGTRTYHRLACAIEDAGFEIRDCLSWMYGSGFPKSLAVDKAIDRMRDDSQARGDVAEWLRPHVERFGFANLTAHFGFRDETMTRARWTTRSQPQTPTVEQWAELKQLLALPDDMDAEVWRLNGRKGTPGENWEKRELIRERPGFQAGNGGSSYAQEGGWSSATVKDTAPATPEAQQWQGWGTALKPAHEPIVMARKPLAGTVAANCLEYGTGALNVDGCRIGTSKEIPGSPPARGGAFESGGWNGNHEGASGLDPNVGRWPANVVLSHSENCEPERPWGKEDVAVWDCDPECPVRLLDEQSGETNSSDRPRRNTAEAHNRTQSMGQSAGDWTTGGFSDSGGASRFFYTAKSSSAERSAGLGGVVEGAERNSHPLANCQAYSPDALARAARHASTRYRIGSILRLGHDRHCSRARGLRLRWH